MAGDIACATDGWDFATREGHLHLYYSPGACSIAAHIVLEEIGVDYSVERVMIPDGENLREPFLSINPRGRLPVLVDGGFVVRETGALLVHLAARFPEQGLLPPPGGADHARCFEWLSWLIGTHHVNLMHYWRPHRIAPPEAPLEAIAAIGRREFEAGNAEIERALAGPWFLGERYTIVDPFLLFCYRQGNRIGLPMAQRFPRYTAWAERMLQRPAVARIWQREGITLDGAIL